MRRRTLRAAWLFSLVVGACGAFTPPEGLLSALETALRLRRERKNAARRPNRIILVRHGESEGNADRTAYSSVPDSQIALTDRGFAQGLVAGLQIRQLVGDESVRCFVSPYLRARQTLLAILRAFDGETVPITSEPRLREQDFGNFQKPEDMDAVLQERQQFGRFYYRFPNGEAGTDVFDRMASFITYLFRTMGEQGYFSNGLGGIESNGGGLGEGGAPRKPAQNYVVVTHGLLMRIFCMCYFRWTVPEFEQVWNPSNCEIWVLEKQEKRGIYQLAGRWRASPYRGEFVEIKFGKDKKTVVPQHMKTPLVSREVTPGAPDALDSDELGFLRDLPGPKRLRERKSGAARRPSSMETAGDAVIAYWARDAKAAATRVGEAWGGDTSGSAARADSTEEREDHDDGDHAPPSAGQSAAQGQPAATTE